MSIFKDYFTNQEFIDKYLSDSQRAIDVIIPVFHTNELWRINLISIYREVPVKRLLISDGGVIDNSLDVLKEFPRVEIFDHRHYKSLGKCIAELIRSVTSEWFAYLHSDVYLPEGWFDAMVKYQKDYDWYGCPMNMTVLINYRLEEPLRPYAGSQIGKKEAFMKGIDGIDDDYVYRQEDFVFNRIVEDAGYKTGKVEDTFHYHQLMYRNSKGFDVNVQKVSIQTKVNAWETKRSSDSQIRGIVKYLDPVEPYVIQEFIGESKKMILSEEIRFQEFKEWIEKTNPKWLEFFNLKFLIKLKAKKFLGKLKRAIVG